MKNRIGILCLLFAGVITADFTVHIPFEEYLKKYPERPNISLGTEHVNVVPDKFGQLRSDSYEEMDEHGMPGDKVTHETSYVINMDVGTRPDLQGDISDEKVWEYLLGKGKGKVHLIWEEHMPIDGLSKAVERYIDTIYDLLKDGGYFVFQTFDDSDSAESRILYEKLYNTVKKKFGASNIAKYPFKIDKINIDRVKKTLIRKGMIKKAEEHAEWDYSSLSFPLTVFVKIDELQPDEVNEWLSDRENLDKLKNGIYRYYPKTREVHKKVIIPSITLFQEFDARMRKVSEIDPILAKYPQELIMAKKRK